MYGHRQSGSQYQIFGKLDFVFESAHDVSYVADAMAGNLMDSMHAESASPRPWRVGRKVGRNVYDIHDQWIGVACNDEMAAEIVKIINRRAYERPDRWIDRDKGLDGR